MRRKRGLFSYSALLCLQALFFVFAGISRYIETDSGNILIHDIDAESWEGFIYGGRLFRPIQANSLNQRPSVLLIPGKAANRYTGDHIAMELARRGFVVLSMEDFSQGTTDPEPDFTTENLVDAGFEFLNTRSFTDHTRIGLVAYYSGTEKAIVAESYTSFASKAFISPTGKAMEKASSDTKIYCAKWESSPLFRPDQDLQGSRIRFYPSSHAGMLVDPAVTAELMQQFHEDLKIPNDSPFWFDAASQNASLLICLRFLLMILLTLVCTGLSTRISSGEENSPMKIIMGFIIPLLVFQIICEIMNLFPVSVRIGSPFNYLPTLYQLQTKFSAGTLAGFIIITLLWSFPLGKNDHQTYTADIFALCGSIICLAGFLPLFIGGRSGWEIAGISHMRWAFALFAFLSCFDSLLLRTFSSQKHSRILASCVTGVIFYIICSCLPTVLLFQESLV